VARFEVAEPTLEELFVRHVGRPSVISAAADEPGGLAGEPVEGAA
jgi:hypothetical protein